VNCNQLSFTRLVLLRHIHLETFLPEGRESVIGRLQAAFEQVADQRNETAAKVTTG
jgi:hypothetical protein